MQHFKIWTNESLNVAQDVRFPRVRSLATQSYEAKPTAVQLRNMGRGLLLLFALMRILALEPHGAQAYRDVRATRFLSFRNPPGVLQPDHGWCALRGKRNNEWPAEFKTLHPAPAKNVVEDRQRENQEVRARAEDVASANLGTSLCDRSQVYVENVSSVPLKALSAGVEQEAQGLIESFVDNACEQPDQTDPCSARGVNVFDSTDDPTCGAAVEAWYGQIRNYTYERYSDWHRPATGHFSQALWNDSEQLGCYRTKGCKALGKQDRLLCLYSPPGNIVGQYPFTIDQWRSLVDKQALQVTTIVGPYYGPGSEQAGTSTSTSATEGSSSTNTTTRRPAESSTTTTTSTTTSRPSTTTTTTRATTTTTTTIAPIEDFTDECIDAHNEKRVTGMTVPIPAVTRNREAQRQAENYRDEIESQGCLFQHSGATQFGENLYKASFTPTCADAVDLWYSQRSRYTEYTAVNSYNYIRFGHFTQVMWAASTGLGCAISTRCRIIVCNYYPAGNYAGRYPFRKPSSPLQSMPYGECRHPHRYPQSGTRITNTIFVKASQASG